MRQGTRTMASMILFSTVLLAAGLAWGTTFDPGGSRSEPAAGVVVTRTIFSEPRAKLMLEVRTPLRNGHLGVVVVPRITPEEERPGAMGCASMPTALWHGGPIPWHPITTGFRALLPIPISSTAERLDLAVSCDGRRATFSLPVTPAAYKQARITVDAAYTRRKPPELAKRIKAEHQATNDALASSSSARLWRGNFAWPRPDTVTSPFGTLRIFNRSTKTSRHFGVDLDGITGDPVLAANGGLVVLAREGFFYPGTCAIIDHGHSLFTMYFHLSALSVREGEAIVRGQQIGLVGSTGRVSGPHLHFAVKIAGEYIDPADLLGYAFAPEELP